MPIRGKKLKRAYVFGRGRERPLEWTSGLESGTWTVCGVLSSLFYTTNYICCIFSNVMFVCLTLLTMTTPPASGYSCQSSGRMGMRQSLRFRIMVCLFLLVVVCLICLVCMCHACHAALIAPLVCRRCCWRRWWTWSPCSLSRQRCTWWRYSPLGAGPSWGDRYAGPLARCMLQR